MKDKLRASDVLNWEYLVRIAEPPQGDADTLSEGLAGFAYNFTSTADEDSRDTLLTELMNNATAHQSKDTTEKILKLLAGGLRTDHEKLRQFAKDIGIALK